MNSGERGAWYTDPYGTDAQERWWDGSRWTKQVRDKPPGLASQAVRMAARPAAARNPAAPAPRTDSRDGFRFSLFDVAGETLRLQWATSKPSFGFELVGRSAETVALINIGWPGALALLACSAGEWRLLKRRRLGWELFIETGDGHVVGWYSGRRWRAGGTIFLRTGRQLDLVKSLTSAWTLRTIDREKPIMHLHGRTVPIRVDLASGVHGIADLQVAVLTACAIPLLDELSKPLYGSAS
jgi:hypothetical protein